MDAVLFFRGIKSLWKTMLAFIALLSMYFFVIVSMYDPELGNVLDELSKAMPELMKMFNMASMSSTLVSFLANYLYGFLMLILPMIFIMLASNKLFSSYLENGSFSYLLSNGNSRSKILFTQMKVLFSGIAIIIVFATLFGIIASQIYFPNDLDIKSFLLLNLSVFLLHLTIASICIFSQVISKSSKSAFAISGGFLIVSYLLHMLGNMGGNIEFLNNLSIFALFDPMKIINLDQQVYWQLGLLAVIAIILAILSLIIFKNRDLDL